MFRKVILGKLSGQKYVKTFLSPKWASLLRRAPITSTALPVGVTLGAALFARNTVKCMPSTSNSSSYDRCTCEPKALTCGDEAPPPPPTPEAIVSKLDKEFPGREFFTKSLHFIQHEACCEQKAATIGGAFLLGQALSFRKRFLRRTINGAILATIVAAVIYPEEAKRLFQGPYDKVKGVVVKGGKPDDDSGKGGKR